jgi:hypothetical protein
MGQRKGGYTALDAADGSTKERTRASGPADSPRQRKEREQKKTTRSEGDSPIIGKGRTDSTDAGAAVVGSGSVAVGESPPAQTAAARGVLSSGARETGAKVVY